MFNNTVMPLYNLWHNFLGIINFVFKIDRIELIKNTFKILKERLVKYLSKNLLISIDLENTIFYNEYVSKGAHL